MQALQVAKEGEDMDEELEELISGAMAARRYMEAARLAARLADVITRELWFEQIADVQVAAYVERAVEEEGEVNQRQATVLSERDRRPVTRRSRRLQPIQEKRIYDNTHV